LKTTANQPNHRAAQLGQLLRQRILVLDGAMGTMVQQQGLSEADYRGDRFRSSKRDLKGLHDLLSLTQPALIERIHREYLEAGADLIETNTFNAQALSLADYGMESLAYEMNLVAAQCARRAADAVMAAQPVRTCWVAGALGPTNKTTSISTDVQNAAARGATFDQVAEAYYDQARGLIDGGVDVLLVETIFDTLNAKAAFFAILRLLDERGLDPYPARAALNETSGGQQQRAEGNSTHGLGHLHSTREQPRGHRPDRGRVLELDRARPAAQRRNELRPGPAGDAAVARGTGQPRPVFVSAHPNAGLPNPLLPTGFPETPDSLAPQLRAWAEAGFLNVVGGCCGTTPDHIRSLADALRGCTSSRAHGGTLVATERAGGVDAASRNELCEHRGTDERYGFTEIRQVDPRRPLR
jgi:5-methyltetrahydrofolate--homocysteine methyltransferase